MKGNLRKIMKTAALAACVSLATSATHADEWRMAPPGLVALGWNVTPSFLPTTSAN
ncbi:hypothetical protein ACVD5Z_002192 [Vibrio fluvialis]